MGRLQRASSHPAIPLLQALVEAGGDRGRFARAGVEWLPRLVASEITTLSVCDLTTGRRHVVGHPQPALAADAIAAFDRHFFEHPLVCFHTRHPEGGAHRISDAVPAAQFRRTALYNDYYRRIGIHHAVAIPLHVDGEVLVSFVLNRTRRDFSDDEIRGLDAVRGALAALYRRIVALERGRDSYLQISELAAAHGWPMVKLDRARRVCGITAAAEKLLADCGLGGIAERGKLPPSLDDCVRSSMQHANIGAASRRLMGPKGPLMVRCLADPDGAQSILVLLSAPAPAHEGAPLTRREREILNWVSTGKTDGQIAAILGRSPRTIQKHLENAYVKLGVENRTAAAMRVRQGQESRIHR